MNEKRPGRFGHVVTLMSLALWAGNPAAFGWGSYGHQQINWGAAQILADGDFGKWLMKNEDTVARLAVTPDYDWKKVGKPPTDPDLVRLRNSADRYEHPLHYFEPDAFILNGEVNQANVDRLPVGNYWEIAGQLRELLAANVRHVTPLRRLYRKPNEALLDFANLSDRDVASFGTAPWRAAQLWRLGVEKLRRNDFKGALMYLGAMGHYVGDCAQPFHGSLDHNGKAHEHQIGANGEPKGTAEGIHAAYETGILNQKAQKEGEATWDPDEKMWDSFDVTNEYVTTQAKDLLARARAVPGQAGRGPQNEADVERAILNLIVKVSPYVEPLEDEFADAVEEENGDAASIRVATLRAFSAKNVTVGGTTKTVFRAAEDQMAEATALLARLWQAAFDVARADITRAPKRVIEFDPAMVLSEYEYPKPEYLPQLPNRLPGQSEVSPDQLARPSASRRCRREENPDGGSN